MTYGAQICSLIDMLLEDNVQVANLHMHLASL